MKADPCGGEDVALWRDTIDRNLAVISGGFGANSALLGDAMRQAVLAPGKRFRGTLILLTGATTGDVPQGLVEVACALELVHTASLVFDDLPCMDNASTRRGLATTHLAHGESRAILAGVALVTEALGLLAAAKDAEPSTRARLVAILANALGPAGLCAGQDLDLNGPQTGSNLTLEHDLKTGVLFAAGFEMFGTFRGLAAEQTAALVEIGVLLGRAFQAYDDLLDVAEDGEPRECKALRPVRCAGLSFDPALGAGDALARYNERREQLQWALIECPLNTEPLARYTAVVLPSVAPRAA